jgi:hypothetical protein
MPLAHAAQAAPCVVTPDPVVLPGTSDPGTYHVDATGGIPLELYEVIVQQSGHHRTDEAGTVARAYADEFGNVSIDAGYFDGRYVGDGATGALWPGNASMVIRRYRTGGGSGGGQAGIIAKCSFTVVG